MHIFGKDDILLQRLIDFYSDVKHFQIFNKIAQEGLHISLRLLDYFATNYSKNVQRVWIDGIDICSDYHDHLDGVKKLYFDPFCRRTRVFLDYTYSSDNQKVF